MIANRLLSNCLRLVERNAAGSLKVRGCHVVAAPPTSKVPTGELCVMTVVMGIAIFSTPAWVLYHLPDYQKEDRNTYTGK